MVFFIHEGDIFKIPQINNFAHGCNCAGAMGKGIALQFREKFPQMYKQYISLCKEHKFTVGDVFNYKYRYGVIYNLGTQSHWKEKAQLKYIDHSLRIMMEMAQEENVKEIAMPAIGAGLGGCLWDDVKRTINTVASAYPLVDLYVIEHYKNIETNITYVKKEWDEDNTIFYLHFIGDEAVRQVEIKGNTTKYLSKSNPDSNDSVLYDQSLQLLITSLSEKDYITKDDFEKVWILKDQGTVVDQGTLI